MRLFSTEFSDDPAAPLSESAFRKALLLTILWPAGMLCLAIALMVVLALHLFSAASWLDHTDEVMSSAWTTEKMALDMETGLRAYEITGAPLFLQPLNESQGKITPSFDALSALVADNPTQAAAAADARASFERWRAFATQTLGRMQSGQDVRSVQWNAPGKALFDTFRARMARFVAGEEQLRVPRAKAFADLRRAVIGALILAGLAGLPLLIWSFRRLFLQVSRPFSNALAAAYAQRNELDVTLRSIGDAVIATDLQGAVVFLNPVAEKLSGWSQQEAQGRALTEVLPIFNEQSGEPAVNPVERVLREGIIVGLANHTVLRPRHGGEIPIEDSAAPIFQADGGMRGVILVFHDISEKNARSKALETALEEASEQAERFRFLAGSNSLQVWTASPAGALDWANENVARYFAVQDLDREVLGDAWAQFVHPDDLPGVSARWANSIATGEPYETEFRLRGVGGDYRWFLVRAEAMRNREGAIVKWFGTNTDTDGLKSAQRAAESASRAKDDFLAALSHELRTPLTPVLMAAAAWRDENSLPDEVRADFAMIERNIGLEARLIDDLLDLTRISRGKLRIRETDCEAHSLIGHVVEILRDEAQSKPVAVELNLRARNSTLRGDPTRLQQVFWNLLRNAIKFTPSGGRITLLTRDTPGGRLCIQVTDTGIGLPPDKVDTIFRAFEQAGRENDHQFGGLGLGLAIARAIVNLHGGRIHAESEGLGKGATFIVELPSAADAGPSVSSEPRHEQGNDPASSEPRPAGLRLLLIEDHEPTLSVLSRLLTRGGHRISTANSVSAASTVAQSGNFDAVITDLGLPDGTGFDAMAAIRKFHPLLPGIALTGYGMEEDQKRSLEAGFFAHLIKPIDFEQLLRTLREIPPVSEAPVAEEN